MPSRSFVSVQFDVLIYAKEMRVGKVTGTVLGVGATEGARILPSGCAKIVVAATIWP